MNKKSLFIRYTFLFLITAFIAVILLNYYKSQKIIQTLNDNIHDVNKAYTNAYSEINKRAELIFFNNLLYDKELINIYMNILVDKKNSKELLYKKLRERFFYFKSYGVKEINFYLPKNELFLSMSNYDSSYIENKQSLKFVNKTLKEIDLIEINKNSAVLTFLKPLLDSNLNHLGVIELSFSIDTLTNLMQKDLGLNVFTTYNKKFINENILEKNLSDFKEFYLNKEYLLQNNLNSVLYEDISIFDSMLRDNKELINSGMASSKEFAFIYKDKYSFFPAIAIPLFNSLTKTNVSYIFAYDGNNENSQAFIINYFNLLLLICLVLLSSFIYLFYKISENNHNKSIYEKKYRDLVNAIDKYVVLVETDKKGIINYVTTAFCDICGYTKEELINTNINIIRHPNMPDKFFKDLWEMLKKGETWEGEIINLDKYGNSYWVKGTIFPKFNQYNEIVGYTSIRVNVTDAKQLKKINHLLKEDLSNKLNEIKMKDKTLMDNTKVELMAKVLDSLAHQWKNPMSHIFIELANLKARIENKDLDRKSLKMIHAEIEFHLKSLSVTLNDFNALFSDRTKSDKYNVYSVVKETLSLVKDECKLHDISISLDSSKKIYCYGVFNELKYIILNLLKYCVEELITNVIPNGSIDISIIEDNEDILIRIQDNNTSSSREIIEHIFTNEMTSNSDDKDIGINLHISKLLIEKIGAKISFEKKIDKTIFYLKLVSRDRRKNKRQ